MREGEEMGRWEKEKSKVPTCTYTCTGTVHVYVKVLHVYTCSYVSEVTFLTFLPAAMGRAASTSEWTSSLSLSAVSALWVGGEERREEVVDETLSAAMVTSSCWEVRERSVAGSCE